MPDPAVHPYIPNTVPRVRAEMLAAVEAEDIEELYGAIPERLRFRGQLDLPPPLRSEYTLRRHLESVLARNTSCADVLNFRGGGCWQHYVPAVCDEIANRAEFVTAYYGEVYTDHGQRQALFEFASMLGELLELDAVSMPQYDWGAAAATTISMASRLTGRGVALVPESLSPERRSIIEGYCAPRLRLETVPFDRETGLLELGPLEALLSDETACVYVESPGYLGTIETRAETIGELAHAAGALLVVGTDPLSLGVLEAPPRYGADLVCGELQPLGIHMHYGGGLAGFLASRDDDRIIAEYPTFLVGIAPTAAEGEYGFGDLGWERMSYDQRGESVEYTGTVQQLWAIVAGVYLAYLRLPQSSDLWNEHYGRVLLLKSALVALALSCSALRWRHHSSARCMTSTSPRRTARASRSSGPASLEP